MEQTICFETNDMMNTAYLDQEDSHDIQPAILGSIFQELETTFDTENYFLEATQSQSPSSLDRSLVRCEQSFIQRLKMSPTCLEQDASFLTTCQTLQSDSNESYLLYATNQQSDESIEQKLNIDYNLENDLYVTFDQSELFLMQVEQSWTKKIVNSTESEHEQIPLVQSQLPTEIVSESNSKIDLTMKVCCKSVYNYLMKPLASKFAKKFVKKHLAPSEKSSMPIPNSNVIPINRNQNLPVKPVMRSNPMGPKCSNKPLEPVKIYSNHPGTQMRRNFVRPAPIQQTLYNYPVNTFNNQSIQSPIRQPSNFANCGDLVYYFV